MTETCSPAVYQAPRIQFSSIQGSSSPILISKSRDKGTHVNNILDITDDRSKGVHVHRGKRESIIGTRMRWGQGTCCEDSTRKRDRYRASGKLRSNKKTQPNVCRPWYGIETNMLAFSHTWVRGQAEKSEKSGKGRIVRQRNNKGEQRTRGKGTPFFGMCVCACLLGVC